jgi:beta-lactamase class D
LGALGAVLALVLVACVSSPPPLPRNRPAPIPESPAEIIDEGGGALFSQAGVDGAFALFDEARRATIVVNPALASRELPPASTFKIPNTLIGLETGVIPDEHFSLKWDGVHRPIDAWNQDQDLARAIRFSVVWFFQEVARRVGPERMQAWVNAFEYGNRDISGGIDQFWLRGGMRITVRGQLDFMRRLDEGQLPIHPGHAALVERLITLDARPGGVLRGKTGLGEREGQAVGWLVGMAERDGSRFVYATVALAPEGDAERLKPLRELLTRRLLVREGALPEAMASP